MGVVVFDTDVVIAVLNADDAHHGEATRRMRAALRSRTRRLICAVNYSETLVGPIRSGGRELVARMFVSLGIETVSVDRALAERAAEVRARTGLKLPDAYALATVIHAEDRGHDDVRLESFDAEVIRAHAELHPAG